MRTSIQPIALTIAIVLLLALAGLEFAASRLTPLTSPPGRATGPAVTLSP